MAYTCLKTVSVCVLAPVAGLSCAGGSYHLILPSPTTRLRRRWKQGKRLI